MKLATLLARQAVPERFGAVKGKHGRIVMPGQLWESNDRRRCTLVRVCSITEHGKVITVNKLTGHLSALKPSSFTVGIRGWSLVQDAMCHGLGVVGTCECEHVAHTGVSQLTPCGNPGHKYGQAFELPVLHVVKTTGGSFNVCPDCAKDCMAEVRT